MTHIEMLIAEVVRYLVYIVFFLQQSNGLQEIRLSYFVNTNAATPGPVHGVRDTSDDGMHVARMKLECVL